MAAMFFEICKYPYSLLFPFGQRYCIPNFKLIGPTVYALQFSNLIAPPSGESGNFFFDQRMIHNMFPEFGEDISFRSRVIAI